MLYSLDRPSARVIGRVDYDDYDDDDTIELELNESAIRALTDAAALALAASEERAGSRLAPEARGLGTRGLEPETAANEPGRTALGREPAAAGQAGEAFERETPAARRVAEAVKEETPAVRQAAEALKEETPAARQVGEALKEETPAAGQLCQGLGQETPAAEHGNVSVARPLRKSQRFALAFSVAAAVVGMLGGLAYLVTEGARHPLPVVADTGSRPTVTSGAPKSVPASSVPASALAPASPATPDAPVRFKNPFDASEVFEFPAGTSRAEMRDAVAELLSQRALERQSLFVKRPRRNTKTADPNTSVTASSVTSRS